MRLAQYTTAPRKISGYCLLVGRRLASSAHFVMTEIGQLGEASWKEFKHGFPKGVGKGAEKSGEMLVRMAIPALISIFISPFAGAGAFIVSLVSIDKRSKN